MPERGEAGEISANPIWTKGDRLSPSYYYWPPIFLDGAASLKKEQENSTLVTQVKCVFLFAFWRIEDTKKVFRN